MMNDSRINRAISVLKACVILASLPLLGSCTKSDTESINGYVLKAQIEQTRATLNANDPRSKWSEGDRINILSSTSSAPAVLSTGAGTDCGEFAPISFTPDYAVYPYSERNSTEGSQVNIYLPDHYDYRPGETSLPLVARVASNNNLSEGTAVFRVVSGIMRISYRNIPAGTDSFILTASEQISGIFATNDSQTPGVFNPLCDPAETNAEATSIRITFPKLTQREDMMFYVPLPCKTYQTLRIALYDGEEKVDGSGRKLSNVQINKAEFFVMPAIMVSYDAVPTEVLRESFTAISGLVDAGESDTVVTYEAEKGDAATNPAVYDSQIRVYQNGGTITVSAKDGYLLTEVCIGSDMSTSLNYRLDDSEEDFLSQNASLAKGGIFHVTDIRSSSVKFICRGKTESSRIYVDYLSAKYVPQSTAVKTAALATPIGVKCNKTAVFSTDIEWPAISGASAYMCELREKGSDEWTICCPKNVSPSVTLHDLEPYTEYEFRVTALSDNQEVRLDSDPSDILSFRTAMWKRVTSVSEILGGGVFVLGYEADANKPGIIFPMLNTVTERTPTSTNNGLLEAGAEIDMKSRIDTSSMEFTLSPSTVLDGAVCIAFNGGYLGSIDAENTTDNLFKYYSTQCLYCSFTPQMQQEGKVSLKVYRTAEEERFLQYNSTTNQQRFSLYRNTMRNPVVYKMVHELTQEGEDGVYPQANVGVFPAHDITTSGAALTANYTSVSGEIIRGGFEWGTSASALTRAEECTPINGTINCSVTDLESGTKYYFRAYIDVRGTGSFLSVTKRYYSDILSFSTQSSALPTWLTSYEIPQNNAQQVDLGNEYYNGRYSHSSVNERFGNTKALIYNTTNSDQKIVVHTFEYNSTISSNYTLLFDKNRKCALWVAYKHNTSEYTDNKVGRNDGWEYDPAISQDWQPNLHSSYKDDSAGLAYDRGHQVASNDRQTTVNQNKQTFYFSNMTPQFGLLNRGQWSSVETKIQNIAASTSVNQELYVVTGPLFIGTIGTTADGGGVNLCSVPTGFYKCAMRCTYDSNGNITDCEGCAYIVETNSSNTAATLKSIDYVETKTGFNFFAGVPEQFQEAAERSTTSF